MYISLLEWSVITYNAPLRPGKILNTPLLPPIRVVAFLLISSLLLLQHILLSLNRKIHPSRIQPFAVDAMAVWFTTPSNIAASGNPSYGFYSSNVPLRSNKSNKTDYCLNNDGRRPWVSGERHACTLGSRRERSGK